MVAWPLSLLTVVPRLALSALVVLVVGSGPLAAQPTASRSAAVPVRLAVAEDVPDGLGVAEVLLAGPGGVYVVGTVPGLGLGADPSVPEERVVTVIVSAVSLVFGTVVAVTAWPLVFEDGGGGMTPVDGIAEAFRYGFILPLAVGGTVLAVYSGVRLVVALRPPRT